MGNADSVFDPRSGIFKFGENTDIDTAAPEDVWSQGGQYTFLSANAKMYASSSNAGDTTQTIRVIGLVEDANGDWVPQILDVELNGQNQVEITGGEYIRVFRAYNLGPTATAGDIYIAETATLSGGVPTDATKIKAKIDIASQQTLMAIWSTASDEVAWLTQIFVSMLAGSPSGTEVNVQVFIREFGGIFLSKMEFGLTQLDPPLELSPKVATKVPPKSDIIIRITTDTNSTSVSATMSLNTERALS